MNSGHYTTVAWTRDGFFEFDDEIVNSIFLKDLEANQNKGKVFSQTAYVALYEKDGPYAVEFSSRAENKRKRRNSVVSHDDKRQKCPQ